MTIQLNKTQVSKEAEDTDKKLDEKANATTVGGKPSKSDLNKLSNGDMYFDSKNGILRIKTADGIFKITATKE